MKRQARPKSLANQEAQVKQTPFPDAQTMVFAVVEAAWSKNAFATKVLAMSKVCSFADYFVIFSGRSDRHVRAIAEAIEEALKEKGVSPLGVEGKRAGTWVLLDYGDVIVHVFEKQTRGFYDLEGLWSDAEEVEVEEPQWVKEFAQMEGEVED